MRSFVQRRSYPTKKQAERKQRKEAIATGRTKRERASGGLESLHRATDTLSGLLAQEVRALNDRQRAEKKAGGEADHAGMMKGLKEATAVLKDLAAVAKTLNEQGAETEEAVCGVVLLPRVEDET